MKHQKPDLAQNMFTSASRINRRPWFLPGIEPGAAVNVICRQNYHCIFLTRSYLHCCQHSSYDRLLLWSMTPIHLNRLLLVLDSANEMTSTKIRSEVACAPIQHLSVDDNEHIQRQTSSPPPPTSTSVSTSPLASPVSRPSQCMAPSAHTCTEPSTGTHISPSRSSKDGEPLVKIRLRGFWDIFSCSYL